MLKPSLILNVALMYAILIGVNLPAPLVGLEFRDEGRRIWYAPPGFVIELAWFVLFAMLGIARFKLMNGHSQSRSQWFIVGLAGVCAAYAFYTLGLAKLTGLSALWFGLVRNVVVILLAVVVAWRTAAVCPAAGKLVVPVGIWTAYAAAIVLGEMKRDGLI